MKPDDWAYTASIHSMLIAGSTLAGSLRYSFSFPKLLRNPITLGLLLLLIPVTVSTFTAVDPALSYLPYRSYVQMMVMMLLIPVVLQTESDLRTLLLVIGLSIGLIGLKFGLLGLLHGGARFSQGYGNGLLSDNNALALGLAMGLPLCWFGRSMIENWWLRQLLLACALGSMAAVIMTYSRGGMLCLALNVLLLAYWSRHKVATVVVFAVLAAPVVYLLGNGYLDRMATLKNPTADSSANDRILAAKAAIQMWKDHPITGVGFGGLNQMALQHKYLDLDQPIVVHNTYIELLVGSGIFAMVIYLAVFGFSIYYLGATIRRRRRTNAQCTRFAMAMQASLLIFCLGSYFLSRVTFDMFYMILAAAAVLLELVRQKNESGGEEHAESESEEVEADASPVEAHKAAAY
jgi:probable O-glycosylation ligase (exosortase A-associated)